MPLEEATPRLPSISRPDDGELIVAMAVDLKQNLPLKKFGTDDLELKADGTPKQQDCVTVLILDGTSGRTSDGEGGKRPLATGELALIWLARGDRYAWYQAKDGHGALDIGDVIRWKFDKTEKSTTGGFDRKVTKFQLKRPGAEHAALVAEAKKHHDALRGGAGLETPAADAGWDGDADDAF